MARSVFMETVMGRGMLFCGGCDVEWCRSGLVGLRVCLRMLMSRGLSTCAPRLARGMEYSVPFGILMVMFSLAYRRTSSRARSSASWLIGMRWSRMVKLGPGAVGSVRAGAVGSESRPMAMPAVAKMANMRMARRRSLLMCRAVFMV